MIGQPPVSVFERIRERSRCSCSYCVAVWEIISKLGDQVEDATFQQHAEHLQRFHGWVPGEVEQ